MMLLFYLYLFYLYKYRFYWHLKLSSLRKATSAQGWQQVISYELLASATTTFSGKGFDLVGSEKWLSTRLAEYLTSKKYT